MYRQQQQRASQGRSSRCVYITRPHTVPSSALCKGECMASLPLDLRLGETFPQPAAREFLGKKTKLYSVFRFMRKRPRAGKCHINVCVFLDRKCYVIISSSGVLCGTVSLVCDTDLYIFFFNYTLKKRSSAVISSQLYRIVMRPCRLGDSRVQGSSTPTVFETPEVLWTENLFPISLRLLNTFLE